MRMRQAGWKAIAALVGVWATHGPAAITGRVVDGANAPLASARVWVKSRPDVFDSTGADGRFSLDLSTSALPAPPDREGGALPFRLVSDRLVVTLSEPQAFTVEVRDAQGRKVATLFRGNLGRGRHSIPVGRGIPGTATGVHYLSVSGRKPGGAVLTELVRYPLAKAAAADDTLIVLRMGHEIKKTPLADLSASEAGDVGLRLRTYRRDTAVAVKAGRRIEVFVPSDYRELYRLPVLYLVHGGGDDERYWREQCKLLDTLNAFADRAKVQPMIIVTPAAGGAAGVGAYGKTADPFVKDLVVDIRAHVETRYKADTSRWARAISGLSAGAVQTWNLTLFYPELWGWSLPMSGGLNLSAGFSHAQVKADVASKAIDVAAINGMRLIKAYTNTTDVAYNDTRNMCSLADTVGIEVETDFATRTGGGHKPAYWNEVFRKYAPLLFKE